MKKQETLKNRTIFCHDNLPILRGIDSESIDLIYLDPPFNKGKQFHAPIGTTAEGARFEDIWTPDSIKDEWHNEINDRFPDLYSYLDAVGKIGSRSAKYYLIYMAVRLMEMRRILKPTGSLYLHCDPTASHYLKLLMDTIFGHSNLRNEIVWCYTGPGSPKMRQFNRKHDVIFWYVKGKEWTFNRSAIRVPHKGGKPHSGGFKIKEGGVSIDNPKYAQQGKILEDWWDGIAIAPRIKKEYQGYPTQKPLKLVERIVKASSNKGDMVLDPFCGCATACIAAEKLERDWVGIDISAKAYELVKDRLQREVPIDLFRGEPTFRQDIPSRMDDSAKKKPTREDKQILFGIQNAQCKGCRTRFDMRHLEVDHIIPRAHGGGHERENLQLLCGSCNRLKGKRPMEYLKARLKSLQV